jgi:HD-like signal output (HDOD) protein
MLLWVHAPELARIARLQQDDRQLRSIVAQRQVLGIELHALEQALMRRWHLPELLARITADQQSRDRRCAACNWRCAWPATARTAGMTPPSPTMRMTSPSCSTWAWSPR